MIVSIDKKLIEPKFWNTRFLYVYALSRACIGISPKEILEWKLKALHYEQAKCFITPKQIKFKFPLVLSNFYWLMQKDMKFSLSGNKDMVLMVIERKSNTPIYSQQRTLVKKK